MLGMVEKVVFGPLKAARLELARVTERKKSLELRRQEKVLELAKAEQDSGVELLDAEDDSKALGRLGGLIARLRAELHVLESAINLGESKLAAADKTVKLAEIADLRLQATTKRKHVEQLKEATAPLLAKLSEIENVSFSRAILLGQPVGTWINVPTRADLPGDLRNGQERTPDVSGAFDVPLSRRLLDDAEKLDATARDLESKLRREVWSELPNVTGGSHRSLAG